LTLKKPKAGVLSGKPYYEAKIHDFQVFYRLQEGDWKALSTKGKTLKCVVLTAKNHLLCYHKCGKMTAITTLT